jgi:hypothetical protein
MLAGPWEADTLRMCFCCERLLSVEVDSLGQALHPGSLLVPVALTAFV